MKKYDYKTIYNFLTNNYDHTDVLTDDVINNARDQVDELTGLDFYSLILYHAINVDILHGKTMNVIHHSYNFDTDDIKQLIHFVKKVTKLELTGYIHGDTDNVLNLPKKVDQFYISDLIDVIKPLV